MFWFLRKFNIFDINGTEEREKINEALGGGGTQPSKGAQPKGGSGLNDPLIPHDNFSSPAWRRAPKVNAQKKDRDGKSRFE